jgi:hypothetical protein
MALIDKTNTFYTSVGFPLGIQCFSLDRDGNKVLVAGRSGKLFTILLLLFFFCSIALINSF